MTSASVNRNHTAPILVLGLGNILLHDDGLGPNLLSELAKRYQNHESVEFMDGGTQGIALLDRIADRQALVVLDAVATGHEPGCVCVLEGQDVLRFATSRAATAQEGNAGELLATAAFLGELPDKCYIVGVEPKVVESGLGLSPDVHRSLKAALRKAQSVVDGLLQEIGEPVEV